MNGMTGKREKGETERFLSVNGWTVVVYVCERERERGKW